MAASCDLYVLFASLSKSEKRYCRMMLASGAGRRAKSCLRLFEILSPMRDFDEAAVRAAVEGEPFAPHLSVTKHHLYEHLLRSLRTFGAARATRSRINGLIEATEVLVEKGLLAQARECLQDARELAERHDYMTGQLVIAQLAWRVDANDGYAGVTEEHLCRRRRQVGDLLDHLANYWDHLHAYAMLSRTILHRGPTGQTPEGSAGDALGALLLELPQPSSANAHEVHLKAQRTYHMLTGRYDDAYELSQRSLRYVESLPVEERLERFNYVSMLFHHAMVSARTGRFTEARGASERLETLRPTGRLQRSHQAQLCFCCRLELSMVDLDHEAVAAMAGELEDICRNDNDGFTRQMRLGYAVQLAYVQFANGYLSEALRTLHPVINDHRPGFRDDMLCIARLYRLMLHFDLGDTELLPYLVRSTYGFISRCRGVSDADRVVLRFMRRLPGIATHGKLVAEFGRMREELAAAARNPAEREASAVHTIIPWLDSKITGRPFGDLVREARRGMAVEEEMGMTSAR